MRTFSQVYRAIEYNEDCPEEFYNSLHVRSMRFVKSNILSFLQKAALLDYDQRAFDCLLIGNISYYKKEIKNYEPGSTIREELTTYYNTYLIVWKYFHEAEI